MNENPEINLIKAESINIVKKIDSEKSVSFHPSIKINEKMKRTDISLSKGKVKLQAMRRLKSNVRL